jgi:perosamine synthetase
VNDIKEIANPGLKVPLARPWFDEREPAAAEAVVASKWLIFGPKVKEFEERFAAMHDAKHGIAVNSGSSALLVAMWALGVGPGDEVIAPDMTFVSTATSAIFLGATPVLCDIERRHHNMCPVDLERRITERTRCIVPVHYAGHSVDMDAILAIADKHGIPVLEDAAEAHLAKFGGRPVGALGKAGIFSFTPSKPMTTGEGGMILTNDDDVAEKCRLFRNFGDTDKFAWDFLGFNFRMPEVMGAIGLHQLDKLPAAVAERREIAARYTAAFADEPAIVPPNPRGPEDINFQLYTLLLDIDQLTISRDDVIAAMQAAGVSTRLYYPPMHRAKVFAPYAPGTDADFPETVRYAERSLSLPIYPGLTGEQQDAVISALLTTVAGARR